MRKKNGEKIWKFRYNRYELIRIHAKYIKLMKNYWNYFFVLFLYMKSVKDILDTFTLNYLIIWIHLYIYILTDYVLNMNLIFHN